MRRAGQPRWLKMAAMRRLGPQLLVTANPQQCNPEEFLRSLVEAEIASRDASNARAPGCDQQRSRSPNGLSTTQGVVAV